MSDEFDFEGNDPEEQDEDQEETGSELEDGSEDSAGDGEDDRYEKLEKRVNDLMSKWQKAEKAREEAEGKLKNAQGSSSMEQYLELARAQARDQVYRSDPRFDEFGLGVELIEGDSPEAMRQSAKRLSAVLDKVASSAESKALKKHGIQPEIKSGAAPAVKDIGSMSDEDFLKLIEKAKSG